MTLKLKGTPQIARIHVGDMNHDISEPAYRRIQSLKMKQNRLS